MMKTQANKHRNYYVIRIPVVIKNPKKPELKKEVNLLVDTGATGCVIPNSLAEELELKELCIGEGISELADGSVAESMLVYAALQVDDQHVITVVNVPYHDILEPIMGFDILDMLEIQIDVAKRKLLRPIKHFRLLKMKHIRAFWWSKKNGKRQTMDRC
jgi:clan AA aspartic protease